jgi:hypothetical protein
MDGRAVVNDGFEKFILGVSGQGDGAFDVAGIVAAIDVLASHDLSPCLLKVDDRFRPESYPVSAGGIVEEWALRNYDQNSYILTRDQLTASKRPQKKLENHQKFNPDNPPGRACC